jgi:hypothetical protein
VAYEIGQDEQDKNPILTILFILSEIAWLASERELGDLDLRDRDDELAAGRADRRVLEAVVLDQPSQERQLSEVGLAGLLDEHLQR